MTSILHNRRVLATLVIVILLASGGVLYYINQYLPAQAAPPTETIRAAQVTQGDLVISASGSGELLPDAEANLGYQSGGVLDEVLVEVGDEVEGGDVLARLGDADAQAQVAQAEISLRQAELQLAQLTAAPGAADLASAQASLASAEADLDKLSTPASAEELAAARNDLLSAQAALAELLAGPGEAELTVLKADMEKAEIALQQAQAEYDKYAWRQGYESSPQAAALNQATIDYARAKANYEIAVAGPTGEELAAAQAKVAQAQGALNELEQGPDAEDLVAAKAKVAQAQAQLDELLAGASSEDLESAQLDVEQARNGLASAQRELTETELRAPFPGVITAVDASAGEAVGTAAFISLADMETPLVRFWVEEGDLASVAVGNPVTIIFEALPDETFTGEVIRVEPALVEVDGTLAVQSWASVDLASNSSQLLSGMTVDEVEVVAAEARDALLVPVQALREMSPGEYTVFVVGTDGELELRLVEVGLKDLVNVEILSGLELGEEVSTGLETGSGGSSKSSAEDGPPADRTIRMMGG